MTPTRILAIAALGLLVACSDAPPAASPPEVARADADGSSVSPPGAPTIDHVSLVPFEPASGDDIRAQVQVSGPGPHRLHFTWQIGGRTIEDDTGGVKLPTLRKGEIVGVTVRASNAAGTSTPVREQVHIANAPPRIVDLRLSERPDDGESGPVWQVEPIAQDPDGDTIEFEYSWFVDDRQSANEGATFPVSDLRRGNRVRVQVRGSDGQASSDIAESGTVVIENTSPAITSTPPHLDENGAFRYAMQIEDADGDRRFRYELVRAPRGMKIDFVSGVVSWKPELDQAGVHPVEIAVDDYHGGVSTQSFQLPIVVRTEDDAPAAPAKP